MKINRKSVGRLATALLATAMLAGTMATTAFAAERDTTSQNDTTITVQNGNVAFNKTIDMDGADGAGVPAATYEFTVGAGTAPNNTKEENPDYPATPYNGTEDMVTNTDKKVTATTTDGKTSTVSTAAITFDMSKITAPGVYYFTLTETDPQVAGMTSESASYILKVYVTNGTNGLTVSSATMYKSGTDTIKKEDAITNTYATQNLTLTKKLTGDMANPSQKFSFTITINDPDYDADTEAAGHMTSITVVQNGQETTKTLSNGVATFDVSDVGNNDIITVKGLPEGATYTITEKDATDYTTSATIDNNKVENMANKTVNGTIEEDDVAVVYTNSKTSSPATGIALTIAPYAAMVVLAAGAAFIFLRKRRNVED